MRGTVKVPIKHPDYQFLQSPPICFHGILSPPNVMILKDESLSLHFYRTYGARCAQGRLRTFVSFLIGKLCFRMGKTMALLKEKRMNVKLIAALFGIAILSGCASSKTSPERHAFYFVSHQSSFTGGNYTSSVQKNYQLNVAQFRELYARGKADRAEGRTQAEASEYAQSIRDQLKENAKSQELFAGNAKDKWSSDMDSKDAILFGNELAATYLDGYNGVQ
ncbi:hypothetical protein HMPREF9086_2632 [Enterobacter hormaechei ATCC 49162]|nr:hypothetical protein HMPREF9086_2632 [Enterobacter hormaechei ATCC 49162]